jgi:hypothetical protein
MGSSNSVDHCTMIFHKFTANAPRAIQTISFAVFRPTNTYSKRPVEHKMVVNYARGDIDEFGAHMAVIW